MFIWTLIEADLLDHISTSLCRGDMFPEARIVRLVHESGIVLDHGDRNLVFFVFEEAICRADVNTGGVIMQTSLWADKARLRSAVFTILHC